MAWKDEEWIEKGRIYAAYEDNAVVLAKRKALLTVPSSFNAMRALPELSVIALIERLKSVSRGTSETDAQSLFSFEEPNASLDALLKACVLPPSDTIRAMVKEFGQLWFNGKARSIKDWTNPSIRYPLSVLTLYGEYSVAFDMQTEWLRAKSWMNRGKITPEVETSADLARKLMFALPWDADLPGLGTTFSTRDLLKLLDDSWLSDSHIDMLLQVLTDRLDHSGPDNAAILAPCAFQLYLQYAYLNRNDAGSTNRPVLDRYRLAVESGKKKNLSFIAHVNGNHWVAWKVDFVNFTYGHGDSLGLSEVDMIPLKSSLEWWLGSFYGQENAQFTYRGNTLAHGDQQNDSYSCGIISYNAIAHDLFGDDLWTIKTRKRHRIDCFNMIVMRYNQSRPAAPSLALKPSLSVPAPPPVSHCDDGSRRPQAPRDGRAAIDAKSSCSPDKLQDSVDEARVQTTSDAIGQQAPRDHQVNGDTDDPESKEHIPSAILQVKAADSTSDLSDHSLHSWVEVLSDCSSPPASTVAGFSSTETTNSCYASDSPFSQNMDVDDTSNPATKEGRKMPEEPKGAVKEKKPRTLANFFNPGSRTSASSVSSKWSEVEIGEGDQHERIDKEGKNTIKSDCDFVGQSRSALHSQKLRAARLNGTQSLNTTRYDNFKARIRVVDRDAQFNPAEWSVRHSRCCKWLQMKSAYSPSYFLDHIRRCKAGSTLHDFSFTSSSGNSDSSRLSSSRSWSKLTTRYDSRSCSGLTASHDPRIATYLSRPTALGGGGRSKSLIAEERYGKPYGELTKHQKAEVDRLHETHWLWVVKHQHSAIFSTSCLQTVDVLVSIDDDIDDSNRTCSKCYSLLQNKRFRSAISLPEPLPSNTKYTNKQYQHEEVGMKFARCKGVDELLNSKDGNTRVAVGYAKGVANGKFREHDVFPGLVNAVMQRMDREERGKKMTNMKYSERFDEFCKSLFLVSPRAHKLVSKVVPMRSAQSIRAIRAKEPQFMPGISDQSFEMANEFVTALKIPDRIVALSADDTKLLATFRPFFDKANRKWYILGGTGEPLLVGDPDKLREELEEADLQRATKVRIWVLTVPFPKVPPMVLAAIAITDYVTADMLNRYTNQIVAGLHEKKIWVVSYACDGTEKERANQRLMLQNAHAIDTRVIRAPSPIVEDLTVNIPLFHGKPFALVQDSAHMLKTGRNNLESGARALTLGNYYAGYQHLRDMAHDSDAPLYIRDVEKTDKQDDRAAARVFSSASIQWLETHGNEYRGTATYAFIIGELVDGYQSRTANILERINMVMRAYYFFQIWFTFLSDAKYPLRTACISREALDITRTIITGFMALIYIYRDYMKGNSLPLIPWLHSSEACEHMFAECRKEVKDFDFATFIHLIPKAQWAVRYSMNFGTTASDAKARASGYVHKWFDVEGLRLGAMALFPTDEDLDRIAKRSYDEAERLWDRLGVVADFLGQSGDPSLDSPTCEHESNESDSEAADENTKNSDIKSLIIQSSEKSKAQEVSAGSTPLPPISSWYPNAHTLFRWTQENDDDYLHSLGSEREILENLVAADEAVYTKGPSRLTSLEDQMLNISCAKHMLDFDTMMRIDSLPSPTDKQEQLFLESCRLSVGDTIANSIPDILDIGPGVVPYEINALVGIGCDKDPKDTPIDLVALRKAHETRFAKRAVRTGINKVSPTEKEDAKARYELIRKISETLRLQQDSGPGTGLERRVRWTGGEKTGNAANAEATAKTKAYTALSRRVRVVAKYRFPLNIAKRLSNGGISTASPLSNGSFAVVYHEDSVLLARVIAVYSRTGGRYRSNAWIPEATSIGQISYVTVQLYEHHRGSIFRTILRSRSHLRVKSFAHLHPHEFLFSLPIMAIIRPDGNSADLALPSYNIWLELKACVGLIPALNSALKKRRANNDDEDL